MHLQLLTATVCVYFCSDDDDDKLNTRTT